MGMACLIFMFSTTNDGSDPAEYVPIDETFNPTVHRVNHAVKSRAIYPEKPVSEIPPTLLRFAQPPQDLVEKVQSKVDSLIEAADVKKGMQYALRARISTNW